MFIADLHLHSHYAYATARDCVPAAMAWWARRKGVTLLGAGDCLHPGWRAELRAALTPAPEEGLYRLRDTEAPGAPRFLIAGEVSCVYRREGRVRRVHLLLLLPSLEAADALAARLTPFGRLDADGRPTLRLDCRDLLTLTLTVCPAAICVPAHIWTPHFSLLGEKAGFDSVADCFGDMTPHIRALETGLSADPPMLRRLSALDGYALISHSDAHSPSRIAREATVFGTALSYPALAAALAGGGGLWGTLELFPEAGKYHYDGHRSCGVSLSPAEARASAGRCPVCGKPLTAGVLRRVEALADRSASAAAALAGRFERLLPLTELLSALLGVGSGSKRVAGVYDALLRELGPELYVLREAPAADIARAAPDALTRLAGGGDALAAALSRLRAGQAAVTPGYDGVYGRLAL